MTKITVKVVEIVTWNLKMDPFWVRVSLFHFKNLNFKTQLMKWHETHHSENFHWKGLGLAMKFRPWFFCIENERLKEKAPKDFNWISSGFCDLKSFCLFFVCFFCFALFFSLLWVFLVLSQKEISFSCFSFWSCHLSVL